MITSPSHLAIAALGLAPEGTMACPENSSCAVCGSLIHEGDLVDGLALPDSFTSRAALAHPEGSYRCGACTAVMTRPEFQMSFSTAIFNRDGYYSIARKENRSWAFLTPPEPPFAICIQNAQQQHVVWRAPVSLSKDILMVRVGEQVIRLRRPALVAARSVALMLNEQLAQSDVKRKPGRPESAEFIRSPFTADWKLQTVGGGRPASWVSDLVEKGQVQPADLAPLECLNGGEVWALNAVLHPAPVKPEPLAL